MIKERTYRDALKYHLNGLRRDVAYARRLYLHYCHPTDTQIQMAYAKVVKALEERANEVERELAQLP